MSVFSMIALGLFGVMLILGAVAVAQEDKNNKKEDTVKPIATAVIFVGLIPYVSLSIDETIGLYSGMAAYIAISIVIFIFYYWLKSYAEKNRKKKIRAKFLKNAADGVLKMPCEWFYKKCVSEKVTDFDNKYHVQKMILIIESMLQNEANNLPKEYLHFYNTEEKVKEYFLEGQKICKDKERAATHKFVEAYETPQNALMGENQELMDIFSSLKQYEGREKRVQYLQYEWKLAKREHFAILEEKAKLEKSMTYIQSVGIEKEKDWAIHGGIANGLAGAGAGMAMAMKTMEENAEIRQRNAVQQAANNSVNRQIYLSKQAILNYSTDISAINNDYQNRITRAKQKVVLDPVPTKELFDSLDIKTKIDHQEKSSVVTLTVTNNYNKDLPEGMEITMDGTVQVKVFCDDIPVDDMCVALPVFGVCCGCTEKINAYPKKYMIDGECRKFRFEIVPNKLWLMER